MSVRKEVLEELRKKQRQDNQPPDLVWTVHCVGSYEKADDFMDAKGMFTALSKDDAIDWANNLKVGDTSGSFEVYSYRLCHLSDTSLSALIEKYPHSTHDILIEDLHSAMKEIYGDIYGNGLDGIHFDKDQVVFVYNPRARMKTNSFNIA